MNRPTCTPSSRPAGGGERVAEICERFGVETYRAACDALLERTRGAMGGSCGVHARGAGLVRGLGGRRRARQRPVPDEADDLARGRRRHFDWTGTDPQAEGPINFHIHEGLCKMFFGVYLIMAFDPAILFNDGVTASSW